MSDQDQKDPVVHSSLSKPLFIWSALLVLSLAWGLWDEMYGIRPWKGYQARFEKLYSQLPEERQTRRRPKLEKQIKASPEYRRLDAEMQAAEKAAMPEASAIDKQVNQDLVPQDPGAQRSVPGSAQPHRRADLPDRGHPQRERQELAAQGDRGAEGTRPTTSRCPASREKRRMNFGQMDQQLQAWKAEEGRAAAEARGRDEEGHRAARRSATSISPTASPTPAPTRSPRCSAALANFDIQHPPDPREGRRPGGPLRVLPPGHARAGRR